MDYSTWKEIKVNVSDILLDYDNPRVFVDDPIQENLLRFLVTEYDSIDLANQINLNRGLPLAEKPVITLENDKYIVLEGNRRISACKLLLNPNLLSENEAAKIPIIDENMREYLENFPVVLAPHRDSAEAFITIRHSGDKSVKRWSTIAATKRFVNRYRKGESINHIARVLDEKAGDVRNGIRFFFFLEYIRNEIEWKEEEKKNLEIYRMETTKLDRFLPFSRKAKEILKISFDANHNIVTELPIENFKAALKIIISRIFIENKVDTRTKIDEVFNSEIVELCNTKNESDSEISRIVEKVSDIEEEGIQSRNQKISLPDKSTVLQSEKSEKPFKEHQSQPQSNKSENSLNEMGIQNSNSENPPNEKERDLSDPENQKTTRLSGGRSATDVEKYTNLTGAYPFINKYQKNKRINTLLKELKSIKYKENKMSSMYLIRSLLETYAHEYIDTFTKEENREFRLKGVAKERTKRNQKLRELLYNNIKVHLKEFYAHYAEEIELLEITFTENNNTAATKIINFYIHSQTQVPDYLELLDSWKKISLILKCLDEILYSKTS